ncbi:MAG: hypothetical protein BMS9Abin28_2639 [Anaerolineae bacterium]|nr:MAG: hypothetical protein BMS9Abin28_2639 [Anaerolineae bacterium]
MSVESSASHELMKSRVAILGTLAELHREPIRYDLKTLSQLVRDLKPDLLCAEIHPEDWRAGDSEKLSAEYREALVPLSRRTDIVIIPVSNSQGSFSFVPQEGPLLGLRSLLVRMLTWELRLMQRLANGPRALNSGFFGFMCDLNCALTAKVCGAETQATWDATNGGLVVNIQAAIRRDPGRRVLVTVDCRRRHRLVHDLSRSPELDIVDYFDL